MIFFSQLAEIAAGRNLQFHVDHVIRSISIDSRKTSADASTLFFAIKGDRHDGHQYIQSLYRNGVRQFVVEQVPTKLTDFPEANILLVTSTVVALQKIVAFHRSSFSYPVVGITGSNGKTIIKEWLFQMLSKDRVVVKNPGSYNSQVGVPLSVWQMGDHHQLGIFEAGISKPGEMANLAIVIQPTIGILTNIGSAHNEGFLNLEQKIDEKLKLFKNSEVLIYCADQQLVNTTIKKNGIKTFSWGSGPDADVKISIQGSVCYVTTADHSHVVNLPFSDRASVENCLHCVALMLYVGLSFKRIQQLITTLRAVPMRMEMKEGINQSYIIDDTYNNDLGGMELSLQFLAHQNQKKKKRLIFSEILESGLSDESLVTQMVTLIGRYPLHSIIAIGPVLRKYQTLFPKTTSFFTSTESFLNQFDFGSIHDEVVLVKGARAFAFEKIVNRLQRKVHSTVMEIDLGALIHNLNFFKSRLKPETKIMVMVKAFAYGSGSPEVANVLQYHKVDYLGVAYVDEGVDLRKNNISTPIMVMNPSEDSFEALLSFNLEPEVYNFKIFHALLQYLENRPCAIHLKLDTGMHRLGFEKNDLPEVIKLLKANPNIYVASIFSHLAGADEGTHDAFSNQQADQFTQCADLISEMLSYRPLYHILNSPGILRLSHLQFDMVRLGIGLYGVDPTQDDFKELQPVASLKTIISQIKNIPKGESIGYGRKGVADKNLKLATIAIGYADGFSRRLSQGVGEVLINGNRARVIGNVCMDMTMVDITDLDAKEGDEVIIFGSELPIQTMAAKINTIPYEILTNVSERVKRVFASDGI
jgi:Alr-MurF fusion protein